MEDFTPLQRMQSVYSKPHWQGGLKDFVGDPSPPQRIQSVYSKPHWEDRLKDFVGDPSPPQRIESVYSKPHWADRLKDFVGDPRTPIEIQSVYSKPYSEGGLKDLVLVYKLYWKIWGRILIIHRGCNQCILSPTDRADWKILLRILVPTEDIISVF